MAKPSNPELWKRITKKVRASAEGGERGRWSAQKAALANLEYKKRGGKWKKTTPPPPKKANATK